jgi:RNase adapter protein RapZ
MNQMQLVIITGMSGSGKTVALHVLEDVGYYCVDNLPPELLPALLEIERQQHTERVAVAIDVRSAKSLPALPALLSQMRAAGQALTVLFLDTATDTLVRRFSETRRMHPLSLTATTDRQHALFEAIELEREMLSDLREQAMVLDTSLLKASQLRSQIKDVLERTPTTLTLVFESFAFKRGIPMDADFVFDVRMLPNPHYEPELRALTGQDAAVADFLCQEPDVVAMEAQIATFLEHWLPHLVKDHRSYATVAIGCTGGQHRSVYLVERLAQRFDQQWAVQLRHREIDALKH